MQELVLDVLLLLVPLLEMRSWLLIALQLHPFRRWWRDISLASITEQLQKILQGQDTLLQGHRAVESKLSALGTKVDAHDSRLEAVEKQIAQLKSSRSNSMPHATACPAENSHSKHPRSSPPVAPGEAQAVADDRFQRTLVVNGWTENLSREELIDHGKRLLQDCKEAMAVVRQKFDNCLLLVFATQQQADTEFTRLRAAEILDGDLKLWVSKDKLAMHKRRDYILRSFKPRPRGTIFPVGCLEYALQACANSPVHSVAAAAPHVAPQSASPYRWHIGVFERAPELFGWPARLLHPRYVALASQLSAALRAHSDPLRLHLELQSSYSNSRFIHNGTEGMLNSGMIATQSSALQLAAQHGLIEGAGMERRYASDARARQRALLDLVVPSPALCQEKLARRISCKLEVYAPHGSLWRTPGFMRKVFTALKALSSVASLAAFVCLLRLLLEGTLLRARMPWEQDSCRRCPWGTQCEAQPSS
eukprot:3877564-Amphidinium_carterae.1